MPPNGTGIWKWNADIVAPSIITIDLLFRANANFTYTPPVFPLYTTQTQQTYSVSTSKVATRVSPFGTPAFDDFQIYTGEDAVGDGATVPPFFRNTVAKIGRSIQWLIPVSYTIAYTYVGAGAPSNTTNTSTVDLQVDVNFNKAGLLVLTWANFGLNPSPSLAVMPEYTTSDQDGSFDPTVAVDAYTLKAGSSIDFGTLWAHVTPNPHAGDPDYSTSSWDVQTSIQATAS